jgi:hypothetical protein
VSYHLSCFPALARPAAFLCVGALSSMGWLLDGPDAANRFGFPVRVLGRICATIGLLIGLWLLYLVQAADALPKTAGAIVIAPNAEKPAAAGAGRARRGIA